MKHASNFFRKFFSISLIISALLMSCNSNINKDDAEKIIKETYGFPKSIIKPLISAQVDLYQGYYTSSYPSLGDLYPGEVALQQNGYRTNNIVKQYESGGIGTNFGPPSETEHHLVVNFDCPQKLTAFIEGTCQSFDGNRYQKCPVKIGTIDFTEINNFRKVSNEEYEVEFYIQANLNEIGKIIDGKKCMTDSYLNLAAGEKPLEYKDLPPIGQPVLITQKILKYDDKWKVSTDDIQSLKRRIEPNQ